MASFLYLIIGILVLALAGLLIYLATVMFKEKKPPKDAPIIINLCSKNSNGRALGIVTRVENGINGRQKYYFDPKDVDAFKTPNPQEESIVVDKERLAILQQGSLSADKNIIINCPAHASDFSQEMRNSSFGKALMIYTEMKNYEKTHIEFLKEGSQRKDKILKEIGDGEISADFMEFIKTLWKEDLQSMISKKEDKKLGSLGTGLTDTHG